MEISGIALNTACYAILAICTGLGYLLLRSVIKYDASIWRTYSGITPASLLDSVLTRSTAHNTLDGSTAGARAL